MLRQSDGIDMTAQKAARLLYGGYYHPRTLNADAEVSEHGAAGIENASVSGLAEPESHHFS